MALPSLGHGAAVLATGSIAGQGLLVVAAPLLTRIYSPSDVGVAAAFAALVGIGLNLSGLRYEVALQLPGDEAEAANVLGVALIAVVATTSMITVIVWFAGGWVAREPGLDQLSRYLWLVPLGLLGGGAYRVLSAWAVRARDYGLVARTGFIQKVLQVVSQVGIGLGVAGPVGLMVGTILGNSAGVGSLARSVWKENRAALVNITIKRMAVAVTRYRRFALISAPAGTLGGFALLAPPLLLATTYGPVVAGWYGLTRSVVSLPASLIGTAVSTAYFGNAAELARTNPGQMRAMFFRTSWQMTILAIIPVAALAAFAPWLFSAVFGQEWRQAGVYARVLAPMVFAEFVTAAVSQTLFLFERIDLQVIIVGSRFVLGLCVLWAAHAFGAPATWALAAYAFGMALSFLLTFVLNARLLRSTR